MAAIHATTEQENVLRMSRSSRTPLNRGRITFELFYSDQSENVTANDIFYRTNSI